MFYCVHSGAIVVVGVCLGSLMSSIVSLGSLGFHSAGPKDRRVYFNSGASGGRLVLSGARGLTLGRISVVGSCGGSVVRR